MANILNKLRDAMLGESYEEDYYDYKEEEDRIEEEPKVRNIESAKSYSKRNGNSSKVVSMHANVQMEVVVTAPENL